MFYRALLAEFSVRPDRVRVSEVQSFLVRIGFQDEITFIGVDGDTGILRGSLVRYRKRNGVYAEPVNCADIYYERNQGEAWIRLVTCKELIHIMDPQEKATSTDAEVESLIERLSLPPELASLPGSKIDDLHDRMTEFFALAILFPIAARDRLRPQYESNVISVSDISRLMRIPQRYVSFVMTDAWTSFHDKLCGFMEISVSPSKPSS